jgi:hypothetical protein
MGYQRLITYTQLGETGTSLRAAGFVVAAELRLRPGWTTPSRRANPAVSTTSAGPAGRSGLIANDYAIG